MISLDQSEPVFSPGLAKHEATTGAGGGGGHPGRDDVTSDGLDSEVVTSLLVDGAIIDLISLLSPGSHQKALISRLSKVILCRGQLDTVTADN